MAESEAKFTPIIPGDVVHAVYKGSAIPVDLKVEVVTKDNRVVLSPDGEKTVITKPDVLLQGGVVDRFELRPFSLTPEQPQE